MPKSPMPEFIDQVFAKTGSINSGIDWRGGRLSAILQCPTAPPTSQWPLNARRCQLEIDKEIRGPGKRRIQIIKKNLVCTFLQ